MINFAHGDLFMIGSFFCFLCASWLGLPFAPALLLSTVGVAGLGVLIERCAYKPLRRAPRVSAIITALGVGLFLENFTLALSPYPQHVPALIAHRTWQIGGVHVAKLQLIIIGLSLVLMLILDFIVRRTMLGMAMRAIAYDKEAAPLMGVPVDRVISITFAIGTGLGGAAGVMYALAFPVIDPYMGVLVGWKAFIAAVIGGIGNIRGAVLGSFLLAAIEVAVTAFMPSTYRDFIAFGLLLVLLVFRPHGLLGQARLQKV